MMRRPDQRVVALGLALFACACTETYHVLEAPDGATPAAPAYGDVRALVLVGDEITFVSDPSLDADETSLFVAASHLRASDAIFVARRASRDAPFDAPTSIDALDDLSANESDPELVGDRTLYFTRSIDGVSSVFVSHRDALGTWSTPVPADAFNQHASSCCVTVSRDQTEAFYAASETAGDSLSIYRLARASASDPFGAPALVSELAIAGVASANPYLSADGHQLFFDTSSDGTRDLVVAERASVGAPFGPALPLTTLNTDVDDGSPWVSADGARIYFQSARGGTLGLYQAERQ